MEDKDQVIARIISGRKKYYNPTKPDTWVSRKRQATRYNLEMAEELIRAFSNVAKRARLEETYTNIDATVPRRKN